MKNSPLKKKIENILYSNIVDDTEFPYIMKTSISTVVNEIILAIEHPNPEEELFITSFLNLFPKGVRTGGKLVRSDLKGCEKKMKQFLKDYKYDKELILKATEAYVNKFKDSNYKFMKAAIYFIGKKGEGSTLAEECENILNGGKEEYIKQTLTLTGNDYKALFE